MKYKKALNDSFSILGVATFISILVSLISGTDIVVLNRKGQWLLILIFVIYFVAQWPIDMLNKKFKK